MNKPESLQNLITSVNGKKGAYPAMSVIQDDPSRAAVISKMITDTSLGQFDLKRKNAEMGLNTGQIQAISDSIRARSKDNESVLQLFPDIELAVQILISSIISPKDMVGSDLIYKTKEAIFPTELLAQLNEIVQTELDGHYRLKDDIQEILRDTLFTTGSHIKVVIPESIVDSMINGQSQIGKESLIDIFEDTQSSKIRSLGFLGNSNAKFTASQSKRAGLEAFFDTNKPLPYHGTIEYKKDDADNTYQALEHIEVTDNFQYLKIPQLLEMGNRKKVQAKTRQMQRQVRDFHHANEDALKNNDGKKLTIGELSQVLYKDHNREYEHLMVLPTPQATKRYSVGRPYYAKVPSTAVIPVYTPGDEKNHVGYFFITDADGHFLSDESISSDRDGLAGLLSSQTNNQNMSSLLIDKAKKNLNSSNIVPTLDNITSVYASIVETDLLERLNNGMYGGNVKVSGDQAVYQIMLARGLKAKMTRLVYVPVELTTYFAFKHFHNGVGKSYLDDVKNLTSIRAILLFSKLMAQVKSSINVTKVTVAFDPDDPDPDKTIETVQHEVAKMRQMYFPLGINSPVDLVDWITRAGLEFQYENHPGVPEAKLTFESDNFKHEIPDNDLDDALRKQTYMALNLPPEVVDNGFNAEYATTSLQNNILLSKRVSNLQDIFMTQLTDLGVKIVQNDQIIRDKFLQVLKDNRGILEKSLSDEQKEHLSNDERQFYETIIDMYLGVLSIELPRPDVTTLETQSEAFVAYEESVDKMLSYVLSDQVANTEIIGLVGDKMEFYKNMYKSFLMRQWAANNNYLPELNDLFQTNEDGKALVDVNAIQKTYVEGIARSFIGFIKEIAPVKQAADADLTRLGEDVTDTSAASDTSSSDDSGGGGADEFGDFGLDDGSASLTNAPTDEVPPEETTPVDEEEEVTTPEGEEAKESISNQRPSGDVFFNMDPPQQ